MKCQQCGIKIPNGTEFCESCARNDKKTEPSDVEGLIREIILEDEQPKEIEEVQIIKPIKKERKIQDLGIKISKIILIICILMYFISMFSPWYRFGGKATSIGFVEIPSSMMAKEYLVAEEEKLTDYQGYYVSASPVQLLLFTSLHFGDYKTIRNVSGKKVRSMFFLIHFIIIATLWIVLLLCLISVVSLTVMKELKSIRFVKISMIVNIVLVLLNLAFFKIPYINMFIIHAKDVIKSMDYINAVSITFKGIAVNSTFYPYTMSITNTLLIALALLGLALVISAFLLEIKSKQYNELKEVELKAKNKGVK